MTRSLAHRGPDDSGYVVATPHSFIHAGDEHSRSHLPPINSLEEQPGTAFIGHRRLAILDKSPQNRQPFTDESQNYCLAFNGEIYNYQELRSSLARQGVLFTTQGDTEVVFQWLIRYGASGLQSLNGMFALVFWENHSQTALIARDIVGMKPLYYSYYKDVIGISSEYRAFWAAGFWAAEPNELAVAEYLWRGKTSHSFYRQIAEVPVGSFMEFSKGKLLSTRRYHSLLVETRFEIPVRERAHEYAAVVHEKVRLACASHQIAEVPLGLALSGGLDSSCLWAACKPKPSTCFTISWPNWSKDESHYARLVTQSTNCQHLLITPTEDQFQQDLPEFVQAQEVPVGSLSVYAQFCLMRAAQRAQVPVVLDGQGGDELFGGYSRFFIPWMQEYLRHKPTAFWKELSQNRQRVSWAIKWLNNYLTIYKSEFSFLHPLSNWVSLPYPKGSSESFSCLNEALLDSLRVSSLPLLLRYADRNAMWFSVESRSPLADDQPLISSVLQIPGMYKIQHFEAKILLKAAFSTIPSQIISRKDKIAFEAPVHQWMLHLPFPKSSYYYSSAWLCINNLAKNWNTLQTKVPADLLWRILSVLYWEKYVLLAK